MPDVRSDRTNFWFNLDLVWTETRRWPVATTVVLTILGAMIGVFAINEQRQDAFYVPANMIGYLSGLLGMKALGHLMTYARAHKAPFPGSYLVATGIVMIPIFVFYAFGFYILGVRQNEFPPLMAMLILFGFGYPMFTVFFAGFFKAQQRLQLRQIERRSAT